MRTRYAILAALAGLQWFAYYTFQSFDDSTSTSMQTWGMIALLSTCFSVVFARWLVEHALRGRDSTGAFLTCVLMTIAGMSVPTIIGSMSLSDIWDRWACLGGAIAFAAAYVIVTAGFNQRATTRSS